MSPSSTEADDETVRNLASAIGHGIAPAALAAADPAAARALTAALIPRMGLGGARLPKHPVVTDETDNELDDREFGEHPDDKDDPPGVAGLDERLSGVDLMAENLRLFRQTRRLLTKVLVDPSTPSNQKAQVVNALSSILKGLTAQQTDVYNAERLRRLEHAIIGMLKLVPAEAQQSFLEAYEREVNVR